MLQLLTSPELPLKERLAFGLVLFSPLWLVLFGLLRHRLGAPRRRAWRAIAVAEGWQSDGVGHFAGTVGESAWKWELEGGDNDRQAFTARGFDPAVTLLLVPREQVDRPAEGLVPGMLRTLGLVGNPEWAGLARGSAGSPEFRERVAVLADTPTWADRVVSATVESAWLDAAATNDMAALSIELRRGTLRLERPNRHFEPERIARDIRLGVALLTALRDAGATARPHSSFTTR